MDEQAIWKILGYIEEYLPEPKSGWPIIQIQQRSYERWAASEILKDIIERPFTDAAFLIENFILKMEFFLRISEDLDSSFIFRVAEDTAETVLSLIS